MGLEGAYLTDNLSAKPEAYTTKDADDQPETPHTDQLR